MQGKRPADTAVTMAHRVQPSETNAAGNIHGGEILKLIDSAAGVVAQRHARCNCVTASIDRVDFWEPVFVGELVFIKASINYVGRSSMEVGVRVEAENIHTGVVRRTNSCYLTFVALDKLGRPTPVAPLILESETEKRRFHEAERRRKLRKAARRAEIKAQERKKENEK